MIVGNNEASRGAPYIGVVVSSEEQRAGDAYMAQADASIAARLAHIQAINRVGQAAIDIELAICAEDFFYWVKWYGWTFDPRNAVEVPSRPTWLPLDLFPRQVEMVNWFFWILQNKGDGCVKKSRDVGFTWIAGAFAWWCWRFTSGFKATFCSNKATLVDELGNPDTIFEKIRFLYRALPKWMLPKGFDPAIHDKLRLIVNPETSSVLLGEGGDNAGRGGRSAIYFIDEAAKLVHADNVDAATSGNTECRIWGSSINPRNENNLFQRKYSTLPPERVFRFHYSDDPRKTAAWKERKLRDTLPENWAAEYEIDDTFTAEDVCIPASWVSSAKRLKKLCDARLAAMVAVGLPEHELSKFRLEPRVEGIAGGDVGGGKAQSVIVARFGPIVASPSAWSDPDTTDTAYKMLDYCGDAAVVSQLPRRFDGRVPRITVLRYDSVAIGQGVASTLKRALRPGLVVTGVNVGNPASDAVWPDGEEANKKFSNAKAEGWWTARERFRRTHEMVAYLDTGGASGTFHPVDELIALNDDPSDVFTERLVSQLSQPKYNRTERGKIQIEQKSALAARRVPSPDYADALILTLTNTSTAEMWAAIGRAQI